MKNTKVLTLSIDKLRSLIKEEISRTLKETNISSIKPSEIIDYQEVLNDFVNDESVDPDEISWAFSTVFEEVNTRDNTIGYDIEEIKTAAQDLRAEIYRSIAYYNPISGSMSATIINPLIDSYTSKLKTGEYAV